MENNQTFRVKHLSKRDKPLTVSLNEREYMELSAVANHDGLNLSAFVRQAALNKVRNIMTSQRWEQ